MIVTNEPGYYADGKYGVRIENVLIINEVETPWNFGDKGFLSFECVTMYVLFVFFFCFFFDSTPEIILLSRASMCYVYQVSYPNEAS